jgi:hypothetical protein
MIWTETHRNITHSFVEDHLYIFVVSNSITKVDTSDVSKSSHILASV